MESSNTSDITAAVNNIRWNSIVFSRCSSSILFTLGIVGHTLSIYVFTRPTLRLNPCARYFLASTIAGYCVIFINIPIRVLQMGYSIDLFVSSLSACKILSILFPWIRILPSWLIVLASADRFVSSSPSATLRGWSSLRVSSFAIPLTTLFIGIIHIHVLVYYTIVPHRSSCTTQSDSYQTVNSVLNLLVYSLIPSSAMLVFGLLTIRYVRQGRRRVIDQNTQNPRQRRSRSTDRHLIQMMLMQSLVCGLTTFAASLTNLYVVTGASAITDPVEVARRSLIANIFGYVGLIGSCMSFYLFTLSSKLFRKELRCLFRRQRLAEHINANAFALRQRD